MSNAKPVEFNLELWDTKELQLTVQQEECLPILKEVLAGSTQVLARVLAESQRRGWKAPEMRALEIELLAKAGKGVVLKRIFDVLAKVCYRHRRLQNLKPGDSPLPRPMLGVKLEKNPFREPDFVRHDALISELRKYVGHAARSLANDEKLQEKALPLAVLSSIANFHVLHESVVIALVEALSDRSSSWITAGKKAGGWLLSLSWGGVDDEERRLLLPDALTGVLLAMVSEEYVRAVFQPGLGRKLPLKKRHKFVLETLGAAFQSMFRGNDVLLEAGLMGILEAAQTVSYLHLTPAVAALRCRKTVSHSPRQEVLARVFSGSTVGDQGTPKGGTISEAEMVERVDPEVTDESELAPDWIKMMRRAFRRNRVLQSRSDVLRELKLAAATEDPAGRVIVGFAIHLLGGGSSELAVSTAERYGLLIARRLGQRLAESDPSTIPVEELADHYRNVLEDDWEELSSDDEHLPVRKNKRPTVDALRLFQKFLEDKFQVPRLDEELASALKRRGLLPVDANFITVDEYQRGLKAIHRVGPPDRRIRMMLWLNVMFGFRCGLRRREAFYLRVEDFDEAEHLYVRSYKLRKVKTSNSSRAIPYGIFLSRSEPFDEFGELKRFIGDRKTGPLFADERGAMLMPEEKAFNLIHAIMRDELGDSTLRFHHLRHSFATLLAAKLLPGTASFCDQYLSRRHPATAAWLSDRQEIRRKLFGCDDRAMLDIQGISHLLGHGGCAVGVENYIHSLDWFAGGQAKE